LGRPSWILAAILDFKKMAENPFLDFLGLSDGLLQNSHGPLYEVSALTPKF
jgi:hypothetical protein